MRKLIAGMKLSLDGKVEGADGMADWVEAWSDDYGLLPQIDAVLLGAGMYPGYERYWTGIRNDPEQVAWITGKPPTAAELEYTRFASHTPHYVLSTTLVNAAWSTTRFIKTPEDVATLKAQPGKDIYLAGGARTTSSLIDAGLVRRVAADHLSVDRRCGKSAVRRRAASRTRAARGSAALRRTR